MLYEKIKILYPEISESEFFPDSGTILIYADENGEKIVKWENEKYEKPTKEMLDSIPDSVAEKDSAANSAKLKRDQLLLDSDWSQLPDVQSKMSEEKKIKWAVYRQDLRDITDQPQFPFEIIWPTKPE